ncbi:acetyl-CoA hydrolase/transferase C-terminal domain-containing protein [Pontitalea aquivivens]|uniref:acetyl-CoA hydrolase/transferase C-terminal domain-containing protein n=1 Tax=Pontitalea aquivivens TaxID=3388663 RepID=UPI003970DA17
MAPARIRPEQVFDHLPRSGTVWLHACSGDSSLIRAGLAGAGQDLSGLEFTGIFVPGLNPMAPLLAQGARFRTFFMMPEMLAAPAQVTFLPLPYRDIRRDLALNPPVAALFMVSPPDAEGNCSFGPVNDFLADIWDQIPVRIAHVNPRLPRTQGRSIPYTQLTAVIEGDSELPESDPGTDVTSQAIAALAAEIIPEGATLQAGLGRVPEALLRGLTGHRNLAIHSGLIGVSTLNLLEAGALRARDPITAGVAIGTRRLYDAVSDPAFRFAPPSVTHDIREVSAIDKFVTVNSAIEVDLLGQAYAEATPKGFLSGPGGASDFAAGARGMDGLRIVALPATAAKGTVSRIVAPGAATGPVSLGRFDVDVVITEFGRADLRGLSHEGRRAALIAIAAPDHREALERG